jgi:16S rRNA (uracil1498-N3)-methyltransferase
MKNLFLDGECLQGSKIVIDGDRYHYLKNVRRLREGGSLEAIIGDKRYSLVVSSISKGRIICEIVNQRNIRKGKQISICVYQGLLKSTKMDFVVSKLSELGVAEFFPLKTQRAVPEINAGSERIDRWKRLSAEGAKVSGFERAMEVHAPARLEELEGIIKGEKRILLFSTLAEGCHIKNLLENDSCSGNSGFHLLFGPEGDFSKEEIAKILHLNAVLVTMGDFVLKSETASIVATGFVRLYYSTSK